MRSVAGERQVLAQQGQRLSFHFREALENHRFHGIHWPADAGPWLPNS
jgi:hypothetical protein